MCFTIYGVEATLQTLFHRHVGHNPPTSTVSQPKNPTCIFTAIKSSDPQIQYAYWLVTETQFQDRHCVISQNALYFIGTAVRTPNLATLNLHITRSFHKKSVMCFLHRKWHVTTLSLMKSLNPAVKSLFGKTRQVFARNPQRMQDKVLRKTDYLNFGVLRLNTFLRATYGIYRVFHDFRA